MIYILNGALSGRVIVVLLLAALCKLHVSERNEERERLCLVSSEGCNYMRTEGTNC